jgi:hypothetical protein
LAGKGIDVSRTWRAGRVAWVYSGRTVKAETGAGESPAGHVFVGRTLGVVREISGAVVLETGLGKLLGTLSVQAGFGYKSGGTSGNPFVFGHGLNLSVRVAKVD